MVNLTKLPYAYNALEPVIDEKTMIIHHDKHHAAYVNNLNTVFEKYPELEKKTVESLLQNLQTLPEPIQITVRNHGGGHSNHQQFWEILQPVANSESRPVGKLLTALEETFTTFDSFKTAFVKAGMSRFGSGWVWLVLKDASLSIVTTPNQDSPYMESSLPIMGIDIWEHAYYLSYQNRREEYLQNMFNILNWTEISKRYNNGKHT